MFSSMPPIASPSCLKLTLLKAVFIESCGYWASMLEVLVGTLSIAVSMIERMMPIKRGRLEQLSGCLYQNLNKRAEILDSNPRIRLVPIT